MTTIVALQRVMMSDGQTTLESGNIINHKTPKLYVFKADSIVVGVSGNFSSGTDIAKFMRDCIKGDGNPEKYNLTNGGFAAIAVQSDPTGNRMYHMDADPNLLQMPEEMDVPFLAVGSGDQFALGALYVGATIEDAMDAAARNDAYTNDYRTKVYIEPDGQISVATGSVIYM